MEITNIITIIVKYLRLGSPCMYVDLKSITLMEIRTTQPLKSKSIFPKINSPFTSNLRLLNNLKLKIALLSLTVQIRDRIIINIIHRKPKAQCSPNEMHIISRRRSPWDHRGETGARHTVRL